MLTLRKSVLLLFVLGTGYNQNTYTMFDRLQQRLRLICSPMNKDPFGNHYVGENNQFTQRRARDNYLFYSYGNTVRGNNNTFTVSNNNRVFGNDNHIKPTQMPDSMNSTTHSGNNTIWGDGNTIWTNQNTGSGNWIWGDNNTFGHDNIEANKASNNWIIGGNNHIAANGCLVFGNNMMLVEDNQVYVSRSYKIGGSVALAGLAAACVGLYTMQK